LGTDAMWIQTIKNNKPLLHILVYCLYRHWVVIGACGLWHCIELDNTPSSFSRTLLITVQACHEYREC
jgi:hypothetical protein